MENDLRQYLEEMKAELRQEMGSMKAELREEMGSMKIELREEIRSSERRTVALVVEVKESLEREIRNLNDKVSLMSTRLDRIAAGSHYVSRLVDWADRQDKIQEEFLARFHSIETRLHKLEKPPEK